MKIQEFIETKYGVGRYKKLISDPYEMVMEQDDLPCDDIRLVDGRLQKVVFLNDEDFITVLELLSYTKEEMGRSKDSDLRNVYFAYMENVTISPMDLESIMKSASQFLAKHANAGYACIS